MRRSTSALVLGVLWGWFAPALEAQPTTAVFETVADTYLRRGSPNESHGGEAVLEIKSGANNNRVLVRFDMAAVAAAVGQGTLASAELELYVETNGANWGPSGRPVDVHRLTSAWTEPGATWNCAADTNPSNNQADCNPRWDGGSLDPAILATTLHTSTLTGPVRFDLTSEVAALLAGDAHFGWSIERGAGASSGTALYASREGTAGRAPKLIVTYEPPPLDTTPPSLAIVAPAGPLVINDPAPQVVVEYADDGAGIDPATLRVKSGSLDFTLTCTVGAASATCLPPFLGSGLRTLSAEVRDRAGNRATASAQIEILLDREPPRLAITAPAAGLLLGVPAPTVTLEYGDVDSGVDPATLHLLLDGSEITAACTLAAGTASCVPAPLAEGPHTLSAEIADRVGLLATARRDFTLDLDAVPPMLAFLAPAAGPVLLAQPPLTVSLGYGDDDTGLDLASFALLVDGDERGDACDLALTGAVCGLDLAAGSHTLEARVRDRAGNLGAATLGLELALDPTPPSVAILTPDQPSYLGDAPAIAIEYADVGSGLDLAGVRIRVDASDLSAGCALTAAGASCPPPVLAEGAHTLTAEVRDRAGNRTTRSRTFVLLLRDRTPPTLTLISPQGGVLLSGGVPQIELAYDDTSGVETSSLFVAVDEAVITPACQIGPAQATCRPAALAAGEHTLRVELRDLEGNLATLAETFTLELQLPVHVTEPATGTLTTATTATVRGTVSPAADAVTVAGVAAVLQAGTFVAEAVPLREGANVLSAVASSALGGVGTDTVTIVRDTLRPQVVIFAPHDGSTTSAQQIVVSGEVNDPASSSSAQTPPVVRVGGVEAQVEQRAFVVPDFLLQPGENVIQVEAVDAAGNVGSTEVRITYVPGATQRIEEILGNGQTGSVGAELAEPLVVRLVDFAGQPLAGRRVQFTVTRGNGEVRSFPEAGPSVETLTDTSGLAQVLFALGGRSGMGNHEVTVSSPGIRGEVVFCASAVATAPRRIKRIVGNNMTGAQFAIAGAEAPYPLSTQVFDDFGNPVLGAEVTYTVLAGDGGFAGEESTTTTTDSAGKASATFTLGPLPGSSNNLVEATASGITETGALFTFSGVAPRDGDTTLSGTVLDNQDAPVPGVTLEIGDRTAVADAEGRFTLTGLPVGTVHLGIDGSTATRPGRWPHLGFEFTLVRGIENSLGMPIRLLPIDVSSGRIVGGPADVVVPMSGIEGAEITVFANSVTFPDGSHVGEVTFTQVHGDKVPMVAPLGSDFMLAWTIQPPGTVFDPPVQIAIPNLGGAPGTVVDMFSFDHDLGEFVTAGTAQISAEGRQLVSTPGSGISKAGWGGCVAAPPPDADTCHPSACTICPPGAKRPEPKCDKCSKCNGGSCDPLEVESVTIKANGKSEDEVVVGKKQEVVFTAEAPGDCTKKYAWDFGDGKTSEEAAPKHKYEEKGLYTVKLEVSCRDCEDNGSQMDELEVRAIEVDLEIKDLPEETEAMPHEEDPGALLVVNDDDDNENDHPDLEDIGEVTDEDDLEELKIHFDDQVHTGELRLEAAAGGEAVKAWEDETKGAPVELPKTWKLADGDEVPESVWVEGVKGSDVKGVELRLLYTNDAGAEVEDKVVATVVDVEFDVLPTETDGVSADDAEYDLVAAVFYRDPADSEKLIAVEDGAEVRWELTEGSGSISPSSSTTKNGLAATTLATSTVPGSSYVALGKLRKFRLKDAPEGDEIEVELDAESADVVVAPGEPATIAITSSSSQQAADATGTLSLQAFVTDRNGNPVEDGTPVSWLLEESTRAYRQTVTETVGGAASAVLVAPVLAIDQRVVVSAGLAEQTMQIGVQPVQGTLTAAASELDLLANATTLITASVNAADGTPVFWTTSNGSIQGDAAVVGGVATATLSTAGGSAGPAVVTATIGHRLLYWQGTFLATSEVSLIPASRFLIADLTEDTVSTVIWGDGSVHQVPLLATTEVEVRGPAGGLARIAFASSLTFEAYNFESESGGVVPGLLHGLDMSLAGAALDTEQALTGAASLRFEPGASATIADATALDVTDDLGISFWLRPAQLTPTTLIGKGDAWSIELLASGLVRATVGTTAGPVTVTSSAPLAAGSWNWVSLQASSPSLLLIVNTAGASAALTAPLLTNHDAVTLGGQLDAHLDDLSLFDAGSAVPLRCIGLDAAGLIQLDDSGRATFRLVSTGTPLGPGELAVPHHLTVDPVGGSAANLRSGSLRRLAQKSYTGGYGCYLIYRVQRLRSEPVIDVVISFFGGDPETTAGIAANVAGGILIVGDIGSIVKNLWRMSGYSEDDPNYPELVLSSLGLLTEFAVGEGEIIDVPISFARAIVARLRNAPLARIIVNEIKEAIIHLRPLLPEKVALLRLIASSDEAIDTFAAVIKSEDVWEAAARAESRLGELFGPGVRRVLSLFDEEITKRAVKVLGELSDDVLDVLKNSGKFDDAVEGLAKMMRAGIDPQLMKRVLENPNILGDTYKQAELLIDLGKVERAQGIGKLVNALKINNVQAKGFRYELEVAAKLGSEGSSLKVLGEAVQIPGFNPPRFTDIDVLVDGIAYQAKRSADAIGYGEKGLESARKWVSAVLGKLGDPSKIKYAIPDGVPVPPKVLEFLENFKPSPIEIVRIAHAKTLQEAREIWEKRVGIRE